MAQVPRQMELFAQAIKAKIVVNEDHELVRLERAIDWDELLETAMDIRLKKIKAPTGPEPHYRELLGAVTLMAVKNITYLLSTDSTNPTPGASGQWEPMVIVRF